MANKMLIDATHPEETRVVVLKGQRVEEFDLEAQGKRQLRGNIYLAKVTRVEPSLQAAFVDYGGNRHGFLAFSEIHPDYYQIPVADREALLAEAAQAAAADQDMDSDEGSGSDAADDAKLSATEEPARAGDADRDPDSPEQQPTTDDEIAAETETAVDEMVPRKAPRSRAAKARNSSSVSEDADANGAAGEHEEVELVGAEDALEEVPVRQTLRRREYKIQEVIRRRQILLVQVVKEERGTKGAALTTYLSLAGRYCVLMPNTARGGGISRKITNATDRRRLKTIAADLEVPQGTGVIVRTAGADRTKAEIKRDFEYLLRLWESIRELTLKSTAPSLIYEEGSLVKRSIRDLYNKDIDEILIEGDESYREAKAFMRMLMPSHAKNVKPYKDTQPLFTRNRVESQLDQMFSPVVTLKSGGYLVINQTEALVAVDVNSGKSTREHNIEDTAFQTNLEAAAEVARQLRLRDLAGLIVIDFIDMEEKRNNRSVERKIKESLKTDRARIQVGRISHFGLLEMSRQRIRAGVLEGTMEACAHCQGVGRVRSVSSTALQIVRAVEEHAISGGGRNLTIRTTTEIALYMLNQKRAHLTEIEIRFGIEVGVSVDASLLGASYVIERGAISERRNFASESAVQIDSVYEPADQAAKEDTALQSTEAETEPDPVTSAEAEAEADSASPAKRRSRRRRGRRGAADEAPPSEETADAQSAADAALPSEPAAEAKDEAADDSKPRRRRGRRGGRRQRRTGEDTNAAAVSQTDQPTDQQPSEGATGLANGSSTEQPAIAGDHATTAPSDDGPDRQAESGPVAWPWRPTDIEPAEGRIAAGVSSMPVSSDEPAPDPSSGEPPANDVVKEDVPLAANGEKTQADVVFTSGADPANVAMGGAVADDATDGTRRGWWQRRFPSRD